MKILFLPLILLGLFGCANLIEMSQANLGNESVMCEGMTIIATNKTGTIQILAGQGFERSYTWDGATRSQVLEPRKKRWVGRLGIGYGAYTDIWKNHQTITNANLEEAQRNFFSIEDALAFVREDSRLDGDTVYNDSGLVVTWKKSLLPYRNKGSVLMVSVWQVSINGKNPLKLPGSQNNKLIVAKPCPPGHHVIPPPYKIDNRIEQYVPPSW